MLRAPSPCVYHEIAHGVDVHCRSATFSLCCRPRHLTPDLVRQAIRPDCRPACKLPNHQLLIAPVNTHCAVVSAALLSVPDSWNSTSSAADDEIAGSGLGFVETGWSCASGFFCSLFDRTEQCSQCVAGRQAKEAPGAAMELQQQVPSVVGTMNNRIRRKQQ